MAPKRVKDPNDNCTAVSFDILGFPVATAIMGKVAPDGSTESGDNLEDPFPDPLLKDVIPFFTDDLFSEDTARGWLEKATTRFVYYLGEKLENDKLTYGHHPACACAILREKHVGQVEEEKSRLQIAFEYSDGIGQALVTKGQAEPVSNGGPKRWLTSGKTILNNKGKPVKQYEPYFSETHAYEEPQVVGVTPIFYYDAVGRLVRTELPDGSLNRVHFSPWFMANYDGNDTVLDDGNQWYERYKQCLCASHAESRKARRYSRRDASRYPFRQPGPRSHSSGA